MHIRLQFAFVGDLDVLDSTYKCSCCSSSNRLCYHINNKLIMSIIVRPIEANLTHDTELIESMVALP